jgi:hypothetical protein
MLPLSLRAGHRHSSPPSFVSPSRSPLVTVSLPQLKQVVVAVRVAGELASAPSCLGKEHRRIVMYLVESRPTNTLTPMHRTVDIEPC